VHFKKRPAVIAVAAACTIAAVSYVVATAAFAGSQQPATHTISASRVADLIGHAPPQSSQEASALADGVVTLDEREAAEQAYLACGEAAGYQADVYPASGQRITRVSFRVPGGSDPDAAVATAEAAFGKCQADLDDIDVVWAQEKGAAEPSAGDTAALYDRLDKCLATNGAAWLGDVPGFAMQTRVYKNANGRNITLPPGATPLTQFQCATAEEAETGLAFPAPTGEVCVQGKMAFGMTEDVARRFCSD
jgi:hypothetical protein